MSDIPTALSEAIHGADCTWCWGTGFYEEESSTVTRRACPKLKHAPSAELVRTKLQAAGYDIISTTERDLLASIVRDLAAAKSSLYEDEEWCRFCRSPEHTETCVYLRARAWLSSQEPTP